jgi:hypothetical protein
MLLPGAPRGRAAPSRRDATPISACKIIGQRQGTQPLSPPPKSPAQFSYLKVRGDPSLVVCPAHPAADQHPYAAVKRGTMTRPGWQVESPDHSSDAPPVGARPHSHSKIMPSPCRETLAMRDDR